MVRELVPSRSAVSRLVSPPATSFRTATSRDVSRSRETLRPKLPSLDRSGTNPLLRPDNCAEVASGHRAKPPGQLSDAPRDLSSGKPLDSPAPPALDYTPFLCRPPGGASSCENWLYQPRSRSPCSCSLLSARWPTVSRRPGRFALTDRRCRK